MWQAPDTTAQDRQEIVRVLVNRVPVKVHEDSAHVEVTVQWAGGMTSAHRLRRPVAPYDQRSQSPDLLAHSDGRRQTGHSFAQMAEHVHREGFSPPKRPERFTGEMVPRLLRRRGLHGPRPRALAEASVRRPHESWRADCAREVPMPSATVHKWPRFGWVHSRTVPVVSGRWALWADADALARLRQLRADQRQWPAPHYPQALTTPKRRDGQPHGA